MPWASLIRLLESVGKWVYTYFSIVDVMLQYLLLDISQFERDAHFCPLKTSWFS